MTDTRRLPESPDEMRQRSHAAWEQSPARGTVRRAAAALRAIAREDASAFEQSAVEALGLLFQIGHSTGYVAACADLSADIQDSA